MGRFAWLLVFALPGLASAEMWRWTDSSGRIHYSNVPGHVPAHAMRVHGGVGYVSQVPVAAVEPTAATPGRLRQERLIKRRLAEIEAFYAQVRARQRARLEAYASSTLLPDWVVADRWLEMRDEEIRLRAELARLEGRPAS